LYEDLEKQKDHLPVPFKRQIFQEGEVQSVSAAKSPGGQIRNPLAPVKSLTTMVTLTLIGMIGLYVGAFIAYQKYQAQKAQIAANPIGAVAGLFSSN
jgi:hypothetical protein